MQQRNIDLFKTLFFYIKQTRVLLGFFHFEIDFPTQNNSTDARRKNTPQMPAHYINTFAETIGN